MSNPENGQRYRLVVFGSAKVGKTQIIRQFLSKQFSERYKETVEDIYSRDFLIRGGAMLALDIIDTNFSFSDMRRINISTANAVVLVFAVNDVVSFRDATNIMEEIRKRRTDDLPIVVAGNKCDLPDKKILSETVDAWLGRLQLNDKVVYVESSAKSNQNVAEIFQALLRLSHFPCDRENDKQSEFVCRLTPTIPRRMRSMKLRPSHLRKSDRNEGKDETQQQTGMASSLVGGSADSALAQPTSPKKSNNSTPQAKLRLCAPTLFHAQGEHKQLTRHASLMRKTQRIVTTNLKQMELRDTDDTAECRMQ